MSYFYTPAEIFNQIYSTGSSGIGALSAEFNRDDAVLNAVFDNTNAALRITTVGSTGDTTYFPGSIHADGDIIGERYIVSSSVVYITQSFMSGSTIFGDTQDDIHQFTGSVSITGSSTRIDGGQLLVRDGTAALPSLSFIDDPTAGFYRGGANRVSVAIAGASAWTYYATAFGSALGAGYPIFMNEAGTATNPNIIPGDGDYGTGIGRASASKLSLIANSKEGIRIDGALGSITSSLSGRVLVDGVPVMRKSDSISSAQTASEDVQFYFCTTGESDLSLIFPSGSLLDKEYVIKKIDSGAGRVAIKGDGYSIDGETTDYVYYQYDSKNYKWSSADTEWFIY